MEDVPHLLDASDFDFISKETEGFTGRRLTRLIAAAISICEAKILHWKHFHVVEGQLLKVRGDQKECKEPNCFPSSRKLLGVTAQHPLCVHDFVLAIRTEPYEPPYVIEGLQPKEGKRRRKGKEETMIVTVRPRQ